MGLSSWIWANKEWLFQGIGAMAVVAAVGLLWRSVRKPPGTATPSLDQGILGSSIVASTPKPNPWWRLVAKIPGLKRIAWRRIYTEQEIDRRVRVRICSDRDGICFWKYDRQGALSVWLDFVNLNPFPLKIECLTGHATVGGAAVAEVKVVDRHIIPACAYGDIHFQADLNPAQIDQIAFQLRQRADAAPGLNLKIYLQSGVRELTLSRTISASGRHFLNFTRETESAASSE